MKKLVVIAVVFSLLAGAAYGQELKFDVYLNSGLGVMSNNLEDSDATLKAFGVDSESNGYRFRLGGSYTNEAKNVGGKFRLQSQRNLQVVTSPVTISGTDSGGDTFSGTANVTNTYGYFSLAYAYGWVSFFENKLTLTGGIVDDSTWQTADWWFNDDLGEGLGLLLKTTPVENLTLGFGAYTITQQTGGSNNILSVNGNLPNFGSVSPKLDQAKYTMYASYKMPDTFLMSLAFRNKNTTMWRNLKPGDDYDNYAYGGDYEPCTLIGELRVLALKELTAVVVGKFDFLDDFSDKGKIMFSETFGYKVNSDINVGLNLVQFMYKSSSDAPDPAMLFGLWGSYAFDNVVPRLDVVYFKNGQSKLGQNNTQWERRGFAAKSDANEFSVFSVRPSVKINVDSKTFVEIGNMLNIDSSKNERSEWGNEKSMISNVFYVDVKFSF